LTGVYTDPPGTIATTTTATVTVPGIVAGQQYRYQVATVFDEGQLNPTQGGTGNNGGGNGGTGGATPGSGAPEGGPNQTGSLDISPLSLSTPWVTAISPPLIVAPIAGQQVNLSQLTVTWQKSTGADQYLIWISTSPNFRNRAQFGPFQASRPEDDGQPTATATFDARTTKLSNANNIFISVGAYSSVDQNRPRPFGAIFSPPVSVQPESAPPPPPSGSASPGTDNSKPNGGKGHKGKNK